MKLRCILSVILAGFSLLTIHAQETFIFEEWVSKAGSQEFYFAGKSITDANLDVYQVGASINITGDYDAIVTKFNERGQELWTKTFDPSSGGDDTFIDVILTASNHLVLTGTAINSSNTGSDVFTIQLDPADGSTDWQDTHAISGSLYNVGSALATDANDNIFITGVSYNTTTLSDVLIMSYDDGGYLDWAEAYDINGMEDGNVKLEFNSGVLTGSGATQTTPTKYRYLITEFDLGGNLDDVTEGTNEGIGIDQIKDMALDDQGNIYVTGYAANQGPSYDILTMKLDEDLNILWEEGYNYPGSTDAKAYGLALDNSNNVLIAGYSEVAQGNTQFTVLKYSTAGNLEWSKAYDVSAGADTAKAITTDAQGNVYVTGSFYNGSNQDLKTIKYSSGGILQWEIDYNGVANGDEHVLDLIHDGNDLLVTGQREESDGKFSYVSIKYSELEYSDLSFSSTEQINGIAFIKNNGQLRDTAGTGHSSVKYMSKYGPTMSFYKDDAFEWMTRTHHNDTTMNDTVHKVSFAFSNPNTGVRVRPIGKSDYFENHYIPHGQKSYERLPVYGKLFYHNIWDGIDMETCIIRDKELRLTVKPNGKANDIELDISGADSTKKNTDGTVSVYFFNGAVQIPRARAYQETTPGNLQELAWQPALKLTGNTLSIDSIGSYNSSKDLVIRISKGGGDIPQADGLCHSTYFGGISDDGVTSSEIDDAGNLFLCGRIGQTDFYPNQNSIVLLADNNPSNVNGLVAKFDSDYTPLYLIKYAGMDQTVFFDLALSEDGNIYAGGLSLGGDIITANFIDADYQDETSSDPNTSKGFLTLFDNFSGDLLYATYFGSDNGADQISALGTDNLGNLYVAGDIANATGFDLTEFTDNSSSYYNNSAAGNNGYLARLSPGLELEWNTLIGGNSFDAVQSIAISTSNDIAIAGYTESSSINVPLIAGTTQDLILGGTSDWFVMTFDSNCELLWGTYEGGNGDVDYNRVVGKNMIDYDESGLFSRVS